MCINQKKRVLEIEYLRGFAILAVVAIHTTAHFTRMQNMNLLMIINIIIDVFSHFAVPAFIFISGFVLSIKYNSSLSKKSFYKRRARSIIPQYLLASFFYIFFGLYLVKDLFEIPSLKIILFWLVTASSSYHLWFFALIIQFYLIYPYIIYFYEQFNLKKQLILFLLIMFLVQESWIYVKMMIRMHSSLVINILLERIFCSHLFYFALGIYTSQNYDYVQKQVIKNKIKLITLNILFTLIISFYIIKGMMDFGKYNLIPILYLKIPNLLETIYFPLTFLLLLLLGITIRDSNNLISNTILLFGNYSFEIYLIHVAYIEVLRAIVFPRFNISVNQAFFYIAMFLLTLFLSMLSVYALYFLLNQKKHCSNN
ncbi:acyltransferase [Methanomethylovorans sp.]|uniref:acyltransferase n=1 Tax=Methanomethylovorans sp. TaxID=2758717 RepID=UPI00345ECCF7